MSEDFRSLLNPYVFETKLPGTGEVIKIKPITTRQLKRALLYETVDDVGKIEEALDEIITECVVTPGFDIDKIYLQDRFFLLVELRKITKGNNYTFQVICQDCSGQFMQTVDLSTLPVKEYKGNLKTVLTQDQQELVKVTRSVDKADKKDIPVTTVSKKSKKSPVIEKADTNKSMEKEKIQSTVVLNDKISVEVGIITRGIQKFAFKFVEDLPELTNIQKKIESVSVMHAECIKTVNISDKKFDNLPLSDKLYMLDSITQPESEKIMQWYDSNDFGLDFNFTQKCPHCKAESGREIPLEDFFY